MSQTIKYLYSQFLLRDVLSAITPGAIVVLTAFLLFIPELGFTQRLETLFRYSRDMHWLLYIPLFGLFYVIGFAIECLERLFGCVHLHTLDDSSLPERLGIFCGNWRKKPDINKEWREKAIEFLWRSSDHDWAGQNYERLVVLKQMCASNFGAIAIAAIFLIVNHYFAQASFILVFIVAFLLLLSLFWGYRDFTIAVTTMEDKFKSLRDEKLREDK